MRLQLALLFLSLALVIAPAPPAPAGWEVTFVELLTSNLSQWNVRDGTTQKNMYGINWARNCVLENGNLVIYGTVFFSLKVFF